jgi:hypothetical protein
VVAIGDPGDDASHAADRLIDDRLVIGAKGLNRVGIGGY